MYFDVEIDNEKCKSCKSCIFSCPEPNVINFEKDAKKAVINAERYKDYGGCV